MKRKNNLTDRNSSRARENDENAQLSQNNTDGGAKSTVRLADFVENPDNPSTATDEDIERLAGKLKRVPIGLTAMRVAYVTDHPAGAKVVISGNKRLRVLKRMHGDDGECPAEWFADVTAMSEAERHEFIVSANVSDGEWDVDKLLAQYDRGELAELMPETELEKLLDDVSDDLEEPTDLDGEDADKPFVVKITFPVAADVDKWLSGARTELDEKYHATISVSGGGL